MHAYGLEGAQYSLRVNNVYKRDSIHRQWDILWDGNYDTTLGKEEQNTELLVTKLNIILGVL